MDIDRFEQLTEIYGADVTRWPQAERAAAQGLARREPAAAHRLARAATLDAALEAWTVNPPSATLRNRVLASAPAAQKVGFQGVRFWLSGAGLATAGVIGVICGVAGATAALAEAHDEAVVAAATSEGLGAIRGLAQEGRTRDMIDPKPVL